MGTRWSSHKWLSEHVLELHTWARSPERWILPVSGARTAVKARSGAIHRHPSGVRLPATSNGLFLMAEPVSISVIYIIITSKMKRSSASYKKLNISRARQRMRLALTMAGIIIAFICSMIFLHDTHSSDSISTALPPIGEVSMSVHTGLVLLK